MAKNDLNAINLTSGVNEHGEGFVTLAAVSEGGDIFIGQLPPSAVRMLGYNCFCAAEGAETDGFIYKLLGNLGVDPPGIGRFISDLRDMREE